MNNRSDIKSDKEIVSEACAWVAQLESGNLSASDLAALREWMGRSPAHAREIHAIAGLSGQLSILAEFAPSLEASVSVGNRLRKSFRIGGIAFPAFAAIAAFVIVSGVVISAYLYNGNAAPNIYKTTIGEYRTIALVDGTTVSLNTDTQIEVDYNDSERRVRLINGEALFEVASNPKRPFVVYSENAVAEAVGTSFVVRLKEAVTELAVVEGVVAFSKLPLSMERLPPSGAKEPSREKLPTAIPPLERVIVKAGQALTSTELTTVTVLAEEPNIPVLTERDLQRKLSWTDGFLEFSETPLEDVVYELTRHNDISIEIADPDLRDLKFGGIFRTGDVEQLLDALAGLGVVIEDQGDNQFMLHAAESV